MRPGHISPELPTSYGDLDLKNMQSDTSCLRTASGVASGVAHELPGVVGLKAARANFKHV